ncbi:MAG: TIGR03546 family protein, partial [Deltaproteobacteria bacterium]|nr:TIGR03546 family protein [Deltaproteobacteria bacterium]
MQFILKLFRALNSAQTPWQVTLAITLGMVVGLTPLSGIQTVVIFFLAFLLNIHLGLFLASSAFFAGIGYLFDPIFEQIGFALLTSK